jgi:hypothetical protein
MMIKLLLTILREVQPVYKNQPLTIANLITIFEILEVKNNLKKKEKEARKQKRENNRAAQEGYFDHY